MKRSGPRLTAPTLSKSGLEEEDFAGSPRPAEFLRRYGAPRTAWDSPPADGRAPEAERGFERAMLEDIEPLARRRGWRLEHIVFEQPEDLSPLVADLYRWWYAARDTRGTFGFSA